MGRSRYPRLGHRLAPASLRELLQAPVPDKYIESEEDAGFHLCDLDESAWHRFDRQTCHALAGEVLRAVGRAARMPMSVGDRRIPPMPKDLKLADLDLEVRTRNCLLAAGMHERPQDLRAMTIEGVLGLRGFWVKCLVDLLTSLEYVNDHPEVRRTLRKKAAPLIKGPRASGRYPRRGQRLAPETIRDILIGPIPAELVVGTPLEGRRFCDLDERVWDQQSDESIARLADLIISRANVSGSNRRLRGRQLPRPPDGMRLEDLALENRTYNCLRREGFADRPQDLGRRTVGDLLAIRAFGAKCLVDLLTSLETLVSREGKLDDKLTGEAKALGSIPEAEAIHFSDPRLGPLLRATDTEANTVAELVDHVIRRRRGLPDPFRLYERLCEIRHRIMQLTCLSLEEELIEIFSPAPGTRDRQIVTEYYGWDGAGGHTLEELGKQYGLSRERIRQVCVRAIQRNRAAKVFAPVMDRALAFISQRLPAPLEKLKAEFDAAGFSTHHLPLEIVHEGAKFLHREPGFESITVGESQLVVKPDCAEMPRTVIHVAKRAALSYGATTINEVAAEASVQLSADVEPALVEVTLQTLTDFEWLDRKGGWFQLASLPLYGLPNMIEKVLAVTGRISVSRLRCAIARYRRTGRKVPPVRVLLEFCRRMPGVQVKGKTVLADPPCDWREVLSGVEAGMVGVLKEHGPVMDRGVFEEHCIRAGINRFSFNAIIMCSPVIAQYGRSVYGLLGAKVDRKTMESLAARKSGTVAVKVLRDYGHTDEGLVYLAYRLSKAAISGGVITVPAAMKETVRGRFTMRTPDGQEAGTLVSKNGCAWGLGPVLRGHRAAPGDDLVILFDTCGQKALVRIGDEPVPDAVHCQKQHAL